ncbi:MAG: hypothetical protein IT201_09280 [Thermoleophilia bacterium]|nr:hypothetical protein [Thermoleophilia bacterium]
MGQAIRIEVAEPVDAADLVRALAARGLPAVVAAGNGLWVEVVSPREDATSVWRDLEPVLERWCAGGERAAVRVVMGATAEPARALLVA